MSLPEEWCVAHRCRMWQPECGGCYYGERDDIDEPYRIVECSHCAGTGLAPYLECDFCVMEVDDE